MATVTQPAAGLKAPEHGPAARVRVPRPASGSAGGRAARRAGGLRAPCPLSPLSAAPRGGAAPPRPCQSRRCAGRRARGAGEEGAGAEADLLTPPPAAARCRQGCGAGPAAEHPPAAGPRYAPRRRRRRWQVPQPETFRSARPAAAPQLGRSGSLPLRSRPSVGGRGLAAAAAGPRRSPACPLTTESKGTPKSRGRRLWQCE